MKYLNIIKKTGGSLSRNDRVEKRNAIKQIQEKQNEIKKLQNEIQELQTENDLKDDEIYIFHNLCIDKEEQNNKLKKDLEDCNINLNYLNNLQHMAARHIYVLRNEHTRLNTEIDRLNTEIDRLNNVIRIIQNNSQIA